jgi:hypothetical protein
MTLIETLLALALLGIVVAAATSWTTGAARASSAAAELARWEMAARETLRLIADDLACGDFDGREERVRIDGPRLIVQTRDEAGPAAHTYSLEDATLMLSRAESRVASVLLDEVDDFTLTLDEETRVLTVTLTHGARQFTLRRRLR